MLGALISPRFLAAIPWSGYLFALVTLVAVRPIALAASLFGVDLSRREWVTAAWFGPKGFASVFYGILVLKAGIPAADDLFHLIALVIVASIVAHSSTDVLIARWFERDDADSNSVRSGENRSRMERGSQPSH
jgi:NhaP-type Na+/H+ or K+/H+ antiporter